MLSSLPLQVSPSTTPIRKSLQTPPPKRVRDRSAHFPHFHHHTSQSLAWVNTGVAHYSFTFIPHTPITTADPVTPLFKTLWGWLPSEGLMKSKFLPGLQNTLIRAPHPSLSWSNTQPHRPCTCSLSTLVVPSVCNVLLTLTLLVAYQAHLSFCGHTLRAVYSWTDNRK